MRSESLRAAIRRAGSVAALAKKLGVTPQAVSQWENVPAFQVLAVEKATGVPRHELRPDLYPPPGNMPPRPGRIADETSGTREGELRVFAIERLAPDVVAALRQRARSAGRTIEDEIAEILTSVARTARHEFAAWTADLRNRLRGRYSGNATADIREDRRR